MHAVIRKELLRFLYDARLSERQSHRGTGARSVVVRAEQHRLGHVEAIRNRRRHRITVHVQHTPLEVLAGHRLLRLPPLLLERRRRQGLRRQVHSRQHMQQAALENSPIAATIREQRMRRIGELDKSQALGRLGLGVHGNVNLSLVMFFVHERAAGISHIYYLLFPV